MTFLVHCDTKRVEESKVFDVPAIDGTDTWTPVHHGELIIAMEKTVVEANMKITRREYSLSANGLKMFGLWTLDNIDSQMAYYLER